MLTVISSFYLILIPFSVRSYAKVRRQRAAERAAASDAAS
jgi:CDP-diacylglycerol--serine O-phosphatidyltransferase